jgi:hypothetical protein
MRMEDVAVRVGLRRGRVQSDWREAQSSQQGIRAAVAVKRPALGEGLKRSADELVGSRVAVHQGDAEPGWESKG